MIEWFDVAWAFCAGCVLGAAFFLALFWTIRKVIAASAPAFWLIASWVVRFAVVLSGFYFVGSGQLWRFLSCAAGFFVGRCLVSRQIGNGSPPERSSGLGGGHAS